MLLFLSNLYLQFTEWVIFREDPEKIQNTMSGPWKHILSTPSSRI